MGNAEKIKVWAFDTDNMRAGEEETFLLKLEFQRRFDEKARVEQQGLPASNLMEDLMERCRYHRHGKFGTDRATWSRWDSHPKAVVWHSNNSGIGLPRFTVETAQAW